MTRILRDKYTIILPTILVLCCHLLVRGAAISCGIIIARNQSPAQFAAFSYYQITIATIAIIASLGLGTTAARHFADLKAESNETAYPLGTLWLVGVLTALLSSAIIMIIPNNWILLEIDLPIQLFAIGVFLTIINIVPSGAIIGLQLYKQNLITSSISSCVLLCGISISVSYQSLELSIYSVILSLLTQFIGDGVLVVREVGLNHLAQTSQITLLAAKKIARFATPIFLSSLVTVLGQWIVGRMILRSEDGYLAFSFYIIGMQFVALVSIVPGVVAKVSFPIIVQRIHVNSNGHSGEIVFRAIMTVLFSSVVFGALLILGTPWLGYVYGESYQFDYVFVMVFALAAVLVAPANIAGNEIVACGGQWEWLALSCLSMGALITAAFWGLGMGALGGGLAQCVSALTLTSTALAFIARREQRHDR